MSMDEKIAIDGLRQVKEVLDKQDIEYWLDSGTLLGAVRDGRVIPWDHDIDLSTWYTNFDKITSVVREIRDKRFEIFISDQQDHFSIISKNCNISVMLYRVNNGKAIHIWFVHDKIVGQIIDYFLWILKLRNAEVKESRVPLRITKCWVKLSSALPSWLRNKFIKILRALYEKFGSRPVQLAIPSHYFKVLSKIIFYGMEFKVPAKTEEYLNFRYGKDWRIPKRDYIYYKDDGAVKRN